jgi:hypothetical protein
MGNLPWRQPTEAVAVPADLEPALVRIKSWGRAPQWIEAFEKIAK